MISLRAALAGGTGVAALGRLVVEDTARGGSPPHAKLAASARPARAKTTRLAGRLDRLRRLQLSRHAPTAALIRVVLLRAAASSPAALAGALRRYRSLLLHGADAQRAGRSLGRAELREFAGELDDQLVFWELVSDGHGTVELALDDLDAIESVLDGCAQRRGGRREARSAALAPGGPTAHAGLHDPARHRPPPARRPRRRGGLVHRRSGRIGPRPSGPLHGHAMVSGAGAASACRHCLVATDVAAEGLDLRRAERVVHYDLPWTPMRLEQREGRAVRLGSYHPRIEVIRFSPPPALEAALRLSEALERKAALPGQAGLGPDGTGLWRWRSALADRLEPGPDASGIALIGGTGRRGVLGGFMLLVRHGDGVESLAAAVGWLDPEHGWTEEAQVVGDRLLEAARAQVAATVRDDQVRAALDSLASPIRARLALAAGRRWARPQPSPSAQAGGGPTRERGGGGGPKTRPAWTGAAGAGDAVRGRRTHRGGGDADGPHGGRA